MGATVQQELQGDMAPALTAERARHTDHSSRVRWIRVPAKLDDEIQRIADREGNGIAATMRRLISAGLDLTREEAASRG